MSPKSKVCKDCKAEWDEWVEAGGAFAGLPAPKSSGKRPAPHPGPRCATHHRERRKALKGAAHERSVGRLYGLKPGQYKALYEAQGASCYICQRATGKTKRLPVDHDHNSEYVRGLLCGPCNKMLGHARDSVEFFERAIEYLREPPAHAVIGKVKPDA